MEIIKMPRKMKKKFLGYKISKQKLKKLIICVEKDRALGLPNSFVFCPKCGCERSYSTDNMVAYPEVWIKEFCYRCGFHVGGADNSLPYHCLDFHPDYII